VGFVQIWEFVPVEMGDFRREEIEVGAYDEAVSTLGIRVTAGYVTCVMMGVSGRAQPHLIMKRTSTSKDARQTRVLTLHHVSQYDRLMAV